MKKFAKLLALVMVLMMTLTVVAFAEPSTMYTLSLLDPKLYMDGQMFLNLEGLNLDFDFYASDANVQGADIELRSGDDYDLATALRLQFSDTALAAAIDGVDGVYGINWADAFGMLGMEIPAELTQALQLPMYTLLHTDMSDVAAIELNTLDVLAEVMGLAAGQSIDVNVDREMGQEILVAMVEQVNAIAPTDDLVAEIKEDNVSFEMGGTIAAEGDDAGVTAIIMDLSGNLLDESEAIPMTFKANLTNEAGDAEMLIVDAEDGETEAKLAITYTASAEKNEFALTIGDDEDIVKLEYYDMPVTGTNQHDYALFLTAEDVDLSFLTSTGTNGDDVGFTVKLAVTEYGSTSGVTFEYAGEVVEEDGTSYQGGEAKLTIASDDESIELDSLIVLQENELDTAEWVLDEANMTDLLTLSDDDLNGISDSLLAVLTDALPTLQENIPGLATLLSGLME